MDTSGSGPEARCVETLKRAVRPALQWTVGIVCLVWLVVGAGAAWGQEERAASARSAFDDSVFDDVPNYVARTWTAEEGLPQNSVWALEQTRDGALWVGTLGGLARFDGTQLQPFSAAQTPGLAGSRVRTLFESSDGTLWIGTENGLSVRRNGTFRHVDGPFHVTSIDEGPDGTVWLGGRLGLYRTTRSTGMGKAPSVERVPLPEDGAPDGRASIWHVDVATPDSVWVAANGSLFLYRDGTFQRRTVLPERETEIRLAVAGREGRVWVSTLRGLASVRDGTVTRYPGINTEVRAIRWAPSGAVWVATGGDGLLRIQDGTARRVTTTLDLPGRLSGLERDASGQWWVGSDYRQGLIRLRPRLFQAVEAAVDEAVIHGVYARDDGSVWAATRSEGLYRLGGPRGEETVGRDAQMHGREGLPSDAALSVAEGPDEALWVGLTAGVHRRTETGWEEIRYRDGSTSARIQGVWAMHRDTTGAMWLGSGKDGLFRYAGGTIERVLRPERYGASRILSLYRDRRGVLWIGTRTGVGRYRDGRVTWYDGDDGLPYDVVRDVHETGDSTVWVTTYGGGIARFEPKSGQFTAVTPADGLPAGTIHTLHEAPDGVFWMTSNEGVFRVSRAQVEAVADGRRERLYVRTFGPSDGMPVRECNGNFQPALTEDAKGRLWIPTTSGLAVVDPHDPALAVPDSIPLHISAARVDGQPQPPDSLRLPPESYRLAVDFAATSLRHADDLDFRYRLDGETWTPARGRQTAEFTNLPAGQHRLEVEATLDGETWYRLPRPSTVVAAPHFWETHWFRGLLVLLAVGVLGGAYALRVRALRRREEKLRRLVDERTARLAEEKRTTEQQAQRLEKIDEEKNRFFANVSHELRTPLTILLGSIQDLLDGEFGDVPAPVRRQIEIMQSNVDRLHRLTAQLLDLARLETADPSLDPEPLDLACCLRQIARSFTPLAERQGVSLDVEVPADTVPCRADTEKLEKIVGNLLSNAIEHTPEGGSVALELQVDDSGEDDVRESGSGDESSVEGEIRPVTIRVRDTGRGIPPERQETIFERFAHTPSESDREGTGIGLALTRELTELHGGSIGVDSETDAGSVFTVRLPLPQVGEDKVEEERGETATSERGSLRKETGRSEGLDQEPSDRAGVVLVVEDNGDVRTYLRRHLRETYRVVEAENGREGWERAQEVRPDLIVADLMMPEMGGIELCRRIRADETLQRTPFVLLTARAAEADAVEGLDAGADAYVTKPFSMDELKARFRRLLDAHWTAEAESGSRATFAPEIDADSANDQFLDRLTAVVDDHLSDSDLTVGAVAEEVGLSPRQLQRRVKDATGMTAATFIRRYRLDVAAQLLEADAGTVSEIAYRVGFGTPETFRTHFRDRFGCAPSEF